MVGDPETVSLASSLFDLEHNLSVIGSATASKVRVSLNVLSNNLIKNLISIS